MSVYLHYASYSAPCLQGFAKQVDLNHLIWLLNADKTTHPLTSSLFSFHKTKWTYYRTLGHVDMRSHQNYFYFWLLSRRHIWFESFECGPARRVNLEAVLTLREASPCLMPGTFRAKLHSWNFTVNYAGASTTVQYVNFLCMWCYYAAALLKLLEGWGDIDKVFSPEFSFVMVSVKFSKKTSEGMPIV